MWRRAALLAATFLIVSVVAMNVVASSVVGDGAINGPVQIISMAKIDRTAILKTIVIRDATPYVGPSFVLKTNIYKLVEFSIGRSIRPLTNIDAGRNDNAALKFSDWKALPFFVFRESFIDEPFYVLSWKIPGVQDDGVESDFVGACSEWSNAGGLNAEVSTLSYFEGLLSVVQLSLSKKTQNASSQYQSDRGDKQSERPSNDGGVGFPFVYTILGFLGTLLSGLRAGHNLYEKRRLWSAFWLSLGALCGAGSIVAIFNAF